MLAFRTVATETVGQGKRPLVITVTLEPCTCADSHKRLDDNGHARVILQHYRVVNNAEAARM